MRGLVIYEDGHAAIETMPVPEISDYQALVKVTAGSICGTDMKILHNNLKGFGNYPTVLGHESVGSVVRTGAKVRNFEIGDKVVMPFLPEKKGLYYSTWGALAEYSVVGDAEALSADGYTIDNKNLFDHYYAQKKIPQEFDDVASTLIITFREILSTIRRQGFHKGQSVVIYGAGPVGLVFVAMFKHLGLSPIIMIDHHSEKLDKAKKLGADYGLNFDECCVPEEVLKILPNKPDILLDAAGVPALINQNLKLVKEFGTVCIYGVTAKNEALISWQEAPYSFNLSFSQWPSKLEEAAVHDEIIDMIQNGELNGMDYISDIFDFDDSVNAINYFREHKNKSKIAIKFHR